MPASERLHGLQDESEARVRPSRGRTRVSAEAVELLLSDPEIVAWLEPPERADEDD